MPIYPYNTKSGDKRYRVTYRDPDHSQRTKRGFRRRKDAQDYLARMTTYISDNDYIDPNAGKTLVCQFADTWLKGKKNVVKPKYYADLECSWRVHVCNAWGNREIASIRHSEIQTWVSELAKKAISDNHHSRPRSAQRSAGSCRSRRQYTTQSGRRMPTPKETTEGTHSPHARTGY